ncbi:MAG TPA: AAA family ATPase, partial [Polyangiaceae bacterium]|nr:AAA family ATPase [Polyangiaceae bacterium]
MRREPLRGRDDEQALLAEALDGVANGRGTVAMISGPAGIGKSALAEFVADEAGARQFAVIRGRAWEFADAPPYFPVGPALRELGLDAGYDPNAFALWERVLGALASTSTPRVWLLEDLHAADLLTLDLVAFLAQPVRSLPLLIVVTVRDADPRIDERVSQRLARLHREGVDLRLGPLSPADVAAIAERWQGRPLGQVERARLVERAEGNPLFVREMAQASRSTQPRRETAVPSTIRKLVQERVSRLPEAAQLALAAGAIVGREFAAGTIAQMLGVLPARAVDDLGPALQAGLVVEARPGVFVFGHVLERDALEDGLTATERARLHGAAEAALATADSSPSVLVERARHALL